MDGTDRQADILVGVSGAAMAWGTFMHRDAVMWAPWGRRHGRGLFKIQIVPPVNIPIQPLKQGGLFATFCGKLFDPHVVKDSFLRGSPILSQKVAKRPPCTKIGFKTGGEFTYHTIGFDSQPDSLGPDSLGCGSKPMGSHFGW